MYLFKQPRSRFWHIGYRLNGKLITRSTRKEARAEAEQVLAGLRSMQEAQAAGKLTEEFYNAITGQGITQTSLRDGIASWLGVQQVSVAPPTYRRYTEITRRFTAYVNDDSVTVRSITPETITGFIAHLQLQQLSPGTIALARTVLGMLFGWLVKTHKAHDNPVKATKAPRNRSHDRVKRRAFTIQEVTRLYEVAPDDFWRYMVLGGLYTGLRMSDLIHLRANEINLSQNVLSLTTRKTGAVLEIPIAAPLRAILLTRAHCADYLWPEQVAEFKAGANFSNRFYEVMIRAGLAERRDYEPTGSGRSGSRRVNELSFHCLRHTFIGLLKTSNVPMAVSKALAAHASDEIHDIYGSQMPRDVLQKAIAGLPALIS